MIANDLGPFYDLPNDEQAFKSAFRKAYRDLSLLPLKEYQDNVSRCHEVYNMIDTLRQNQGWKRHFPGLAAADKKLNTLKDIADKWTFNDARAIDVMTQFHQELTEGIEKIFRRMNQQSVQDSMADLDNFLTLARPKYLEVSTTINELMKIKQDI